MYKNRIKEQFEGVIFSHECIVEKSKDPKSIWVFTTEEEKWYKYSIQGVTKGLEIKLMLWACIWGKDKSPLIPIFDRSMDGFVYIVIMEDGLIDV